MIPEADFIAFPFTFLMLIDQFQYEQKATHKETQGHVFCKGKNSTCNLSYLCGESTGQVSYLLILPGQCQGTQPPPLYCFSGFLLGMIAKHVFLLALFNLPPRGLMYQKGSCPLFLDTFIAYLYFSY